MASIDLIKASNGAGDAVQATVTSARVIGSTTLKVSDVTNFPEGQFIGTTGTIDNTGVFDPATLTVFTAHLSGADVEIDNIAPGYADLGNTNGQVLVIKPNTLWADNLADTLAVSHNADGTLKNNAVTTAKIADSNVTTAKIADSSVTAEKIDFTTFPQVYDQIVTSSGKTYTATIKGIYAAWGVSSNTTGSPVVMVTMNGVVKAKSASSAGGNWMSSTAIGVGIIDVGQTIVVGQTDASTTDNRSSVGMCLIQRLA